MQHTGPYLDFVEPSLSIGGMSRIHEGQYGDDSETGGNRRSFKIADFTGVVDQIKSCHVKTGQPADATGDEVNQDCHIPEAAQTKGIAHDCWRHPERHRIRQRAQISAQAGGAFAPAGYVAVKDITDQRNRKKPERQPDQIRRSDGDIFQAEKETQRPAGRIRQRENIRHAVHAEQGKMSLGWLFVHDKASGEDDFKCEPLVKVKYKS